MIGAMAIDEINIFVSTYRLTMLIMLLFFTYKNRQVDLGGEVDSVLTPC